MTGRYTLLLTEKFYEYRKTAVKCEADSGSVRRQTVKITFVKETNIV